MCVANMTWTDFESVSYKQKPATLTQLQFQFRLRSHLVKSKCQYHAAPNDSALTNIFVKFLFAILGSLSRFLFLFTSISRSVGCCRQRSEWSFKAVACDLTKVVKGLDYVRVACVTQPIEAIADETLGCQISYLLHCTKMYVLYCPRKGL